MKIHTFLLALVLAIGITPAFAQDKCVTPQQFDKTVKEQVGVGPMKVLNGEAFRQYAKAFNKVAGNPDTQDQPYDTIHIYALGDTTVGWALFKDGCIVGTSIVPKSIHDKIMEIIEGQVS